MSLKEQVIRKTGIAALSLISTATIGGTLGASALMGVYKTAIVIDKMESKAQETIQAANRFEERHVVRDTWSKDSKPIVIAQPGAPEDATIVRAAKPEDTQRTGHDSRVNIGNHEKPAPAPATPTEATTIQGMPHKDRTNHAMTDRHGNRYFKGEAVPMKEIRDVPEEIPEWAKPQLEAYVKQYEQNLKEAREKRAANNKN